MNEEFVNQKWYDALQYGIYDPHGQELLKNFLYDEASDEFWERFADYCDDIDDEVFTRQRSRW